MVNAPNGVVTQRQKGDQRNRGGIEVCVPTDRPTLADSRSSYTKHWHADSTQDDQSRTNSRLDKYTDVVKYVGGPLYSLTSQRLL